jgi:hypothetical protein
MPYSDQANYDAKDMAYVTIPTYNKSKGLWCSHVWQGERMVCTYYNKAYSEAEAFRQTYDNWDKLCYRVANPARL